MFDRRLGRVTHGLVRRAIQRLRASRESGSICASRANLMPVAVLLRVVPWSVARQNLTTHSAPCGGRHNRNSSELDCEYL